MEAAAHLTARQRSSNAYKWSIVGLGVLALVDTAMRLPLPQLDLRFVILAAAMVLVSSRLSVQIPRINTNVTVSDAFIFLVMLLYGGSAGIGLAALEGFFSGIRITKGKERYQRVLVVSFNAAMMTCSTALTVAIVRFFFGPIAELRSHGLSAFVAAIVTMGLVQYFANSGICALGLAFNTGVPFWRTWHQHYLWTSITYLVGASIAAISLNSVEKAGLTVVAVCVPAIFVVYFTYHKYLEEIKATGRAVILPVNFPGRSRTGPGGSRARTGGTSRATRRRAQPPHRRAGTNQRAITGEQRSFSTRGFSRRAHAPTESSATGREPKVRDRACQAARGLSVCGVVPGPRPLQERKRQFGSFNRRSVTYRDGPPAGELHSRCRYGVAVGWR